MVYYRLNRPTSRRSSNEFSVEQKPSAENTLLKLEATPDITNVSSLSVVDEESETGLSGLVKYPYRILNSIFHHQSCISHPIDAKFSEGLIILCQTVECK